MTWSTALPRGWASMIVLNNLPDCKSHIVICEGQDKEKEKWYIWIILLANSSKCYPGAFKTPSLNNDLDLEAAHPQSGSSSSIPGRIGIWKYWFWGDKKTGIPREKPLRARERTNNKLNPIITAGIWTQASLVGGKCPHHYVTLAPLTHHSLWVSTLHVATILVAMAPKILELATWSVKKPP